MDPAGAGVFSVGEFAMDGCSVAGFGGDLYVAWTAPSGQVYYSTVGQVAGTVDPIALYNISSAHAPALASFDGDLYIGWTGTNGELNVRNITTSRQLTFEHSGQTPSLDAAEGYLNIAWTGTGNNEINVASLPASLSGEHCKQTLTAENSALPPQISNIEGYPYLAWTGEDSGHHINLLQDNYNPDSINGPCSFPDTSGSLGSGYQADTAPGLSPLGSDLWIIWGGTDGHSTLNITQS